MDAFKTKGITCAQSIEDAVKNADLVISCLFDDTSLLDMIIDEGLSGTFDMAFIDADKESYKIYYEKCLELLRPGGLILIDNVLWYGRPADPDASDADTVAIREFNKFVYKDFRVDISLLSVGDGLTLARKL